jgi:DNA-binding beta-propeller fold protein YncE
VSMTDITGAGWAELGTQGNGTNEFYNPRGIAVDAGGLIYVTDSSNCRIVRMSDIAGAGWTTLGRQGGGTNQFTRPYGIAVDASSTIYVADTDNSRIVRTVMP